ncbi:MAG: calcium-binding protein [Elainella sp.]
MSRGKKTSEKWTGTNQADTFFALGGNDVCIAGAGNDLVNGGTGGDEIKGGAGNDNLIGGAGDDDITGDAGNDTINGGAGDDTIDGGSGNDTLNGGAGNDTIDGGSGRDLVFGDAGDDNISGGTGNDTLDGGDGNDFVSGNKGDDRMIGGLGDDTLDWDDGDGSDVMSGNDGRDTIEVDGSVTRGDNFVLGKTTDGRAFFERVGLDGQAIGRFNLTVDTAEVFDVSGDVGNDTFVINDVSGTGVELIQFDGGEGNDWVDGRATTTPLVLDGGSGDDVLIGGTGTFAGFVGTIPATLGDTLTGGAGKDKFQFATDPFAGGTPGQNLNQPDVVTDYEIGVDQFVFDKQKFGLNELKFQKGNVAQLSGDSNLLVLEGQFANAGQAAAAIRDNNNLTAGKGIFVYHNSTFGISRVVYSSDLANGGAFSVQANINNLNSYTFQTQFTAADFALA